MYIHGLYEHAKLGEVIEVLPSSDPGHIVGVFHGVGELGLRAFLQSEEPDSMLSAYHKLLITTDAPGSEAMTRLLDDILPSNPRGIGRVATAGYQVHLEKHRYSRLLTNMDFLYETVPVFDEPSVAISHHQKPRSIRRLFSYGWQARRAE